jgi:ribosomal protein S6--L-glutamate ligase
MRFCFIIEERYRNEPMPMVIADQLRQWGHTIDELEPQTMVTNLSNLPSYGYDAYVLKTVSDGPGLIILEAAEAAGILTINNSRSIRLVRDKAVAATFARAHGLPIPTTYFVAHLQLLKQIPPEDYPLVVKPNNGSSCRDIYRLASPADLALLGVAEEQASYFLAQHYVENTGYDIKLYVTGKEVYAVAKKSPLHGEVREGLIPVTPDLRKLALEVGKLFGLDIFGLDVVETPQGLALLDINDFPSFGLVPRAVARVAEYVLHAARQAESQREARLARNLRRRQARKVKTDSAWLSEPVAALRLSGKEGD